MSEWKMRSEQEMMQLILDVAQQDDRIRAVVMHGSRANPKINKDKHQDYDIVYMVTETTSFLTDKAWISIFGEIAMKQEPDSNDLGWGLDADASRSYTWLMLFQDGSRIDLQIQTIDVMLETYGDDTLTVLLLDKDQRLPALSATSDQGYWIQKPTQAKYDGCCNEFWWCLNNVAKGIVRDQLPYAMRMYYETSHRELDRMVAWYIGANHNFSVSAGMWGKYYQKYLPASLYEKYLLTFSDGEEEHLWDAIATATLLFRELAMVVAEQLDGTYPHKDDDRMTQYLRHMRGEQESANNRL